MGFPSGLLKHGKLENPIVISSDTFLCYPPHEAVWGLGKSRLDTIHYLYIYTMWGLQMIDKLANITPKTKVYYTMWLFHSSPWKIHPFLRTANHLFLWAIYTIAMLDNQRVNPLGPVDVLADVGSPAACTVLCLS